MLFPHRVAESETLHKELCFQNMCIRKVLPVFDCILIVHRTQQRRLNQSAEDLKQIQIVECHLPAVRLLYEDQHHKFTVSADPRQIGRIALQQTAVCPHLTFFQCLHRLPEICDPNRIRKAPLHFP